MFRPAEEPTTDANTGHDGFIWSTRASMVVGFVLALALAVAKFAPALAVPLEWPH